VTARLGSGSRTAGASRSASLVGRTPDVCDEFRSEIVRRAATRFVEGRCGGVALVWRAAEACGDSNHRVLPARAGSRWGDRIGNSRRGGRRFPACRPVAWPDAESRSWAPGGRRKLPRRQPLRYTTASEATSALVTELRARHWAAGNRRPGAAGASAGHRRRRQPPGPEGRGRMAERPRDFQSTPA